MNPQNFTRDQALNPNTPIEVLTQIAQTRPDLLSALAVNPSAPADMLNWLSSLNNPEVSAALSQRRAVTPPPPPAPQFSEPQQGYGQPVQSTGYDVPGQNPNYAVPGTPPKKSKRGLIIGSIVAGALVIGGGAWAANHFLFSKLGGSDTPTAAVEQLLEGLESKDFVAMYGSISPVDAQWMSGVSKSFTKHFDGQIEMDQYSSGVQEYLEGISLKSNDVTYEVEEINDDYARVKITGGDFVLDGDPQALATASNSLVDSFRGGYVEELINESGEEFPTSQEITTEVTKAVEEAFPVEFTAADLTMNFDDFGQGVLDLQDLESLLDQSGVDIDEPTEEVPLYLVAAKEDGAWFVSPMLTVMDIQANALGLDTDYNRINEVVYSDTPEEAASAMVAGTTKILTDLDLTGANSYFVEAERRMGIAVQELPLEDYELEELKSMLGMVDISDAQFSVDRQEGDLAYLKLDNLTISADIEGSFVELVLASDCTSVSAEGMNLDLCLQDIPAAQELGLDQVRLIAVKEAGGWVIASSQSTADTFGILGSNAMRLAEEGKLTDSQWWIDNSGVLYQYLQEF